MERLIELLEDLNPEVDYETCTDLIDGHYLDSLAVLSLVADIEEEFDVVIPTVEVIPANFNSAQAIYNMIVRLQEEE
ncbi:MAG: acyl carrier protein [Erysipelotrichaceae bacterium]|nr:acyl carrier protein [Erysipelotrichaceae bacterium]